MAKIVTLTTDYGDRDGYVGAVKGVLLRFAPDAQLVDVTHQIPPHDIEEGAYVFYSAARFFPEGTYHLVVVDPGVGGDRRPIGVRSRRGVYVGPDNGLLSWVYAWESPIEVYHLTQERFFLEPVCSTFHGRDIFAPVVGHLLQGLPIRRLGPRIQDYVLFEIPKVERFRGGRVGEIVHVDRFGNCVTNLTEEDVDSLGPRRRIVFRVGKTEIRGIKKTFASVAKGEPVVVIGGAGTIEIALREGSAAERFSLQVGDPIEASL